MTECRFNEPPDNCKHDKTEPECARYFPSRYLVRFDDRLHHGDSINERSDGAANLFNSDTAGFDRLPVLDVAAISDIPVFFGATFDCIKLAFDIANDAADIVELPHGG